MFIDLKQCWKMASIWVGVAVTAFGALDHDTQVAILTTLFVPQRYILVITGISFIISRIIKQRAVSGDKAA